MKQINSKDLLTTYRDLILKYMGLGYGRVRARRAFIKKTGKDISVWAMDVAIRSLRKGSKQKSIDEFEEEDLEVLDILEYKKKIQKKKFKSLNNKVNLLLPAKPLAIWCLGDPHLDNDGCAIVELTEQMEIIKRSKEPIYSGCVGDLNDNWIGRLSALYANSSITASDGWKLSKWFLSQLNWLFFVGGNHDSWANRAGINPLQWLCQLCNVRAYGEDEVRIEINWLDHEHLEKVEILARHDFKGRSWFHPTHGPNKEALLDGQAHIFVSGHIHTWAYLQTEQRHGRVTHAIRVKGYKQIDSYAKKNQFFTQKHGSSCLIVIDPKNNTPNRVQVFWDIKNGVDYFNWLYEKKANQKD